MPAHDQQQQPAAEPFRKWLQEPLAPAAEQAELLRELIDEVKGLRADIKRSELSKLTAQFDAFLKRATA